MAFKKMEEGPYYVVRVNELFGKACDGATIEFPSAVAEAFEVDGQERRIGKATVETCAGTTSARIRRRYSER